MIALLAAAAIGWTLRGSSHSATRTVTRTITTAAVPQTVSQHTPRGGAVLARAPAFGLIGSDAQELLQSDYADVLGMLAREDGLIRRIGWVDSTLPVHGDEIAGWFETHRDRTLALSSPAMRSMISAARLRRRSTSGNDNDPPLRPPDEATATLDQKRTICRERPRRSTRPFRSQALTRLLSVFLVV